jgi:hypothetical protein
MPSRGEICLASVGPTATPLIDPNYAADPYDMQVLIVNLQRRSSPSQRQQPSYGKGKSQITPGSRTMQI